MKLLKQNCSLIISKANQWLDKNKDRSQSWLDYNFPAMFLHLCKGNSEFNFLKDIGHYNMLRNKNFRYKIVENKLVEIKFVSLYSYYFSDEKVDKINSAFRLALPVTFGLNFIPQLNKKVNKTSPLRRGRYRYGGYQSLAEATEEDKQKIKTEQNIRSLQYDLNSHMSKLQKFFN